MKKITLFCLLVTLFVACSPENETTLLPEANFDFDLPGNIDDGTIGEDPLLYEDVLYAGQTMESGIASVENSEGELIILLQNEGDWEILETHICVGSRGGLPTNGGGNPKIGQFPYAGTHAPGTTEVSYNIPGYPTGSCVYVAIHAVVYNTVTGETETAWAAGEPMGGSSWATWFEVCL